MRASGRPTPRRERWKQMKYGIARQGEVWRAASREGLHGSTRKHAGKRGPGEARRTDHPLSG